MLFRSIHAACGAHTAQNAGRNGGQGFQPSVCSVSSAPSLALSNIAYTKFSGVPASSAKIRIQRLQYTCYTVLLSVLKSKVFPSGCRTVRRGTYQQQGRPLSWRGVRSALLGPTQFYKGWMSSLRFPASVVRGSGGQPCRDRPEPDRLWRGRAEAPPQRLER